MTFDIKVELRVWKCTCAEESQRRGKRNPRAEEDGEVPEAKQGGDRPAGALCGAEGGDRQDLRRRNQGSPLRPLSGRWNQEVP